MVKFLKEHWILVFSFLLLVMMSLPLLYFGNLAVDQNMPEGQPEGKPAGKAGYRLGQNPAIGICLNSLMEPKWIKEKAIWLKESKQKGLALQVKIAHYSLNRQIEQIKNLIGQKVKVIILVPVSRFGLADVLEEATRQGIKIIYYEEQSDGPADLFVGIDYHTIGKIQADVLTKVAGAGNYLIFRGPRDSYQAEMIYQGQMEGIRGKQQIKLAAVEELQNWSAEEAVLKIRAAITHQKLTAVLAPNDVIAAEVAKFLREQKFTFPYLSGSGGDISAYQRIRTGEQFLTVYYDCLTMAHSVLVYAQDLSLGRPVAATDIFTVKGSKIPGRFFPVYLVDKNNLEAFLNR